MENPFEILLNEIQEIRKTLIDQEKLIRDLNKTKQTEKVFLNIEETSKLLRKPKSSVYGLTHRKQIPFYKSGRLLLFKKSELIEFIERTKH